MTTAVREEVRLSLAAPITWASQAAVAALPVMTLFAVSEPEGELVFPAWVLSSGPLKSFRGCSLLRVATDELVAVYRPENQTHNISYLRAADLHGLIYLIYHICSSTSWG